MRTGRKQWCACRVKGLRNGVDSALLLGLISRGSARVVKRPCPARERYLLSGVWRVTLVCRKEHKYHASPRTAGAMTKRARHPRHLCRRRQLSLGVPDLSGRISQGPKSIPCQDFDSLRMRLSQSEGQIIVGEGFGTAIEAPR